MAATIILCVLFYAFSDPDVRLCVFGNAFVAAESEQVQRESRRNRSQVGASRTRAPEGRLHRRVPEAAAPARRREGAVSRFSAPPRQDGSQDHSTTRVPAASARHPEAKSVEERRSARPSGAGERAPRPASMTRSYSRTAVRKAREAMLAATCGFEPRSMAFPSGESGDSGQSAAPLSPETYLTCSHRSPRTSAGEEPGPLSEEVIRMIVKPLPGPQRRASASASQRCWKQSREDFDRNDQSAYWTCVAGAESSASDAVSTVRHRVFVHDFDLYDAEAGSTTVW